MKLDTVILVVIAIMALLWSAFVLAGFVALWPYGLLGILTYGVFAFLIIRVIRDRLRNTEDDHYEKNVHQ